MRHRSPGPTREGDHGGPGTLVQRFERHLRHSGLIEPDTTVLVAVSGGPDSMALLSLLDTLSEVWRLELVVAHFDHPLRPESREEAQWLADLCEGWGLPIEIGLPRTELQGQEAARRARYDFFEEVAERRGADLIATAHHADDQAETVLFHISRGTGIRGLAGIPPRRGRIVRPLLPFWRTEINTYIDGAGLPFLTDPSNLLPRYTRNRLRLEVIPLLEEVVPGASRALVRLSDLARTDLSAWRTVLDQIEPEIVVEAGETEIVLARAPILSYHPRIRGLLVRRLIRRLGSRPDRSATRAILAFIERGRSGGEIDLAGGVRFAREFDHFRVSRVAEGEMTGGGAGRSESDRPVTIPGPESGTGLAVLGGDRQLAVEWMRGGEGEPVRSTVFDPAEVRFPLEIRGWRPGDRIQMSYGTKKLKKLFAEHRVGRSERTRTPILAEVGGRVLWVVGVARAAIAEPEPGEVGFRVVVSDLES